MEGNSEESGERLPEQARYNETYQFTAWGVWSSGNESAGSKTSVAKSPYFTGKNDIYQQL
jgi:hypothetical protein